MLHALCAFANDFHNLGGGYIIIGVEEENGRPILPPAGLPVRQIDAIQKEIVELGYRMVPYYHPIIAPYEIAGKHILVLWAAGGQTRPYKAPVSLARGEREFFYYIRKGSVTLRAGRQDETELMSLAATVPFDDRMNQSATLDDLDLVAPMAEDASPEVRANVGSALVQIGDGKEKERVIPALMKLLQDEDPKIVDSTIRSMWGQYASPEFDELLIKLSRHPKHRYNTIYFCLSTMKSKSVRVCRRLIEELDELDANNSSRGAWGLTYGVADEAKSLVEDGLLRAMPEETSDYTRRREFQALRNVATEKSRPYLTSVVENELETDKYKERALAILKDLDEKP